MDAERIKEAFLKVKQDIEDIAYQLQTLGSEMQELKQELYYLKTDRQTNRQTHLLDKPTDRSVNTTPKLNELIDYSLEALKSPNLSFSTGNEGVPTDRQTNQQTDRQTENTHKLLFAERWEALSNTLESLDTIKKELRGQFLKLTNQEMRIFAAIYQLENEGFIVDYPLIAEKFKLSESSVRDYTLKIIKKGIPLKKKKHNNKKITLEIPKEFKKIASLQTILTLREL